MKLFLFAGIVLIVLVLGFVFSLDYFVFKKEDVNVMGKDLFLVKESKRDIPSPLSPEFVAKVEACGKIDLIDRASPKYNPRALVDGSLKECGD